MKKTPKLLLLVVAIVSLGIAGASYLLRSGPVSTNSPPMTTEEQDRLKREVEKIVELLRTKPSMDTTIIDLDIEGTRYKIPRNFISNIGIRKNGKLEAVDISVTYPGFKPLDESNKACFFSAPVNQPPGCDRIDFWINKSLQLTDEEHFNNIKDVFRSSIPKQGPYGFAMYEIGPEESRDEVYIKKTALHTLLFNCLIFDNHGVRAAVCGNYDSPLPNGNSLSYRLRLNQLKDAEGIDNGLRDLIKTWAVEGYGR